MIDCYFINISNAAKIQKNSECSVQKAELFEDYGGYGVFGAPSRAHQTANKRPQGAFINPRDRYANYCKQRTP